MTKEKVYAHQIAQTATELQMILYEYRGDAPGVHSEDEDDLEELDPPSGVLRELLLQELALRSVACSF